MSANHPQHNSHVHEETQIPSTAPLTSISSTTTPPRPLSLLLVNPNSTTAMTTACLASLSTTLPAHTTLTAFTAPHPSPTAIESLTDSILSTEACLRALPALLSTDHFDGILVACFSNHPLITALREELPGQPVIGIMEAALYAARMLSGRFGIVCTSSRSKVMHEDAVRHYGLDGFCVGVQVTGLGVLETHGDEAVAKVEEAARVLVGKGAESILLACAGFTKAYETVRESLGREGVEVVDGVRVGVQMLAGLCREGLVTAKGGSYKSAGEGRRKRGQNWL